MNGAQKKLNISLNEWVKIKNGLNQPVAIPTISKYSKIRTRNDDFFIDYTSVLQSPLPRISHTTKRLKSTPKRFNTKVTSSSEQEIEKQTIFLTPAEYKIPVVVNSEIGKTVVKSKSLLALSRRQAKLKLNIQNKKNLSGKKWHLRPEMPPSFFVDTESSRNEKQRMWREYREALKPFKNRDFANAKRIIQRLSKRKAESLSHTEQNRLQNALEFMTSYKDSLNKQLVSPNASNVLGRQSAKSQIYIAQTRATITSRKHSTVKAERYTDERSNGVNINNLCVINCNF